MGAALPVVSVGLSVASSLGAARAQQRQVSAQAKALENQNLIAKDQLSLATKQLEAQKQTAEFLAYRETQLNQAQVDQARLAQTENEMRQQLTYTGAESQINQQNQQVKQAVNDTLGKVATENSQGYAADAAQLEQLASYLEQTAGVPKEMFAQFMGMSGGKATNVSSQVAQEQAAALQGIEQYQRGMDNSEATSRTANYNKMFSDAAARLMGQFGDVQNQFSNMNLDYQKQSDVLGNQLARSDIDLTGKRNAVGIQAQKYAGIAAANMGQTNALFEARNQNSAYQASLSSLKSQRPGILSYANILGQGYNALNQLGIFGNQPTDYSKQPAGYSFNNSVKFNTTPTAATFSTPPVMSSFNAPGNGSSTTFDSNATSFSGGFS
jgi:hypothetical protein